MAAKNVAQKLIESHLVQGEMVPDGEIHLKIDQTLTQDATGTMVMLELEAMGLDRVKTELSAQYVDHNLLQTDFKNPDDHVFLQSACEKFGVWYSRAGNGVSHPVHMERFGIPGKTLLGSDSHTPAAGSLGMLAIGTGGLEVALAMVGKPFVVKMPKIVGVELTGSLPDWVSAKDVILEMLRRHDVKGGVGKIIEYYGPGVAALSSMDRHVIANMGAELGATTTVFPSDAETQRFLVEQRRGECWRELTAEPGCIYDEHESINLSALEPLIALPSSPGNVKPVHEVAGAPIYQAMVGSSANPGLRDFAITALIVQGKRIADHVSFDINPTSRQILQNLTVHSFLESLIAAGARIHQPGCNGCIGMGQAPATGQISVRTNPRNFPGRSGTKEDSVYLCSPETAAASALTGVITDPRTLEMPYPHYERPKRVIINTDAVLPPLKNGKKGELIRGPNIKPLPTFGELEEEMKGPILLKMGDNVSTDEILPGGTNVLPFRSNIPRIARFTFCQIDESYYDRAMEHQKSGSFLVGGENYGQGSSREHAAITPRFLGVRAVLAKSYARIHRKNLVNFGILPLLFLQASDYQQLNQGDTLALSGVHAFLRADNQQLTVRNETQGNEFTVNNDLSADEREMLLHGGLVNLVIKKG